MTTMRLLQRIILFSVLVCFTQPVLALDEALPDSDMIVRALADELARALDLQVEDLEKPYFIQYTVDDNLTYNLAADYGALTTSDRDRSRRFYSRVRVGSYELDNTNYAGDSGMFFGAGFDRAGRQSSLPLDDDYLALRQAIWRATDKDYKGAVETLTKKRAYMKDKNIADRPHDFSAAPPVEHLDPTAVLRFDRADWEDRLCRISAHCKQYPQVQHSGVQLFTGAGNTYIVTSEGTRLRYADTGAVLRLTAEVQAEDGMRLSGGRSYAGESAADLPPVAEILADIDTLVAELTASMAAPIVEQYTGPVLFDGHAAGQMFQALLAKGVAGKVEPLGSQRSPFGATEDLEKKLDKRVLPRSFQVYDDPTVKQFGDEFLFGYYPFDDEGVPAQRVDIVVDGKLKGLCMSRVPTRKLSGTNGHARRAAGAGAPSAAVASLFIEFDEGLAADDLKAALIEAAEDEGLDYAVRIESIRSAGLGSSQSDIFSFIMRAQRGRAGGLGDPVIAYKVYTADGREEPFRGCEFGRVDVTDLRRILAAGDTPEVYNYIGGFGMGGSTPPSTIVAPPVLFEEMELAKIEQEHEKRPLLKAPLTR